VKTPEREHKGQYEENCGEFTPGDLGGGIFRGWRDNWFGIAWFNTLIGRMGSVGLQVFSGASSVAPVVIRSIFIAQLFVALICIAPIFPAIFATAIG
jgi:hypothetical protein